MNDLLKVCAGVGLMLSTLLGNTENPIHCAETGPPKIWVVKSPYPFQAGAEKTYDELYHGLWKTRVDIILFAKPRSRQVIGKIEASTVVQALLGETIVVHPFRFIAAKDVQVVKGLGDGKVQVATMRKGDLFWVLDSGNEGEFAIWWRCSVVGWDSTEPSNGDQNRLEQLGTNQENWVKVKNPKTGLSGWFKDIEAKHGPKLVPAQARTKSAG